MKKFKRFGGMVLFTCFFFSVFLGVSFGENKLKLSDTLQEMNIGGELWMVSVNRKNIFFSEDGGITGAGNDANWVELVAKLKLNGTFKQNVDYELGFLLTKNLGEDIYQIWESPRNFNLNPGGIDPDKRFRVDVANFTIKKLFDLPMDLKLGRFNYQSGHGFLVGKGSIPTSGGAWIYLIDNAWNGGLLTYQLDPVIFELLGVKTDESWDDLLGTDSEMYGVTIKLKPNTIKNFDGGIALFTREDSSPRNLDTSFVNVFFDYKITDAIGFLGDFAYQFGKTGKLDKRAYGLDVRANYLFKEYKSKPTLEIGYAYFSGDGNPFDKKDKNFDGLFPAYNSFGKYKYGDLGADYFANTNGQVIMASLGFLPIEGTPYYQFGGYYYMIKTNEPKSKILSHEIDLPVIYPYSDNILLFVMPAVAIPGKAAKQDLLGMGSKDKTYYELVLGALFSF